VRPVNASSQRADRRRTLLPATAGAGAGAMALAMVLVLPWTLHAQTTGQRPPEPPPGSTAQGSSAQPPPGSPDQPAAGSPAEPAPGSPAEPAPQPPREPAPESPSRPVATAPPSTEQPLLPPPAVPATPPSPPPAGPVPAAPPAAPDARYIIRPARFATPPPINGRLDDPIWRTGTRITGFTQLEPHEGAPESELTEVFLGYDQDNLYIGAHCHDSEPKKIITTTLTRDSDVGYDDTLTILLDTYHDGRTAYLFTTNSGGVQVDALVRNEGEQVNLDWDGIWMVEGGRDATGWTVTIAIPFSTVRFPNRPEQIWGINLERDVARKHEKSFWKPVEHSWFARYKLASAGTLVGMQGAKPGRRYHVIPYAVVGAQKPKDRSTSALTQLGGDIKVNVASDLVADVTVKTDFSEAEADEQDVNLTRNALLFPEKRAFFLEGASLFYFGERPDPEHPAETFLFFSRQIGLTPDGRATIPILGGVKLTGHQGGYEVGTLSIETAATRKPDGYGGLVIAPRTNWSVVRLKRDLPGGSSFGIIGLSKDAVGDKNEVAGGDWDVALNQYLRSGGYFAKSWTPGVSGADWVGSTDLLWDSRNARIHYQYTEIGKGFNDELGFITRNDIRAVWADNYWILWPEWGPFKQAWFVYSLTYVGTRSTDELQTRINHAKFSGYFRDGSGIAYKYYDETEVFTAPFEIKHGLFIPAGIYHFGHHFAGFQTDYTKPLGAAGRLAWGDYFDGHFLQYFGYVAYRPVPGLFAGATFQQTQVHLKEGSFTSDILLGEVSYAFTHLLSVRAWVQWEKGANLRQKFDVDWEFRPGSKLFIVYQDIKTDINFFDPRQPTFGTPGRSLLAKLEYYF